MILLLACSASMPPGDPARPDIVLVSIDSLRADHLGSYGNPRQPSPFLDRLAAEGTRYTRAKASSPWTLPSHVTMLSGVWPTEHGVIEDTLAIPPDLRWLPAQLQAAGWATAGFVATVYVSKTYGFDRGFDRFEDFGIREADNLDHPVRADRVVDEALAWGREQGGKPAFVFLHLYDVHYPYLPPEPYNTRYDKAGTRKSTAYKKYDYYLKNTLGQQRLEHLGAQYDECIAYVDDQLARFAAGWSRPVRFVITADHGEELGERGSWGHAHTLYPEVLDVPLIVTGTGPAVDGTLPGTIDVATRIAALAGIPWAARDAAQPFLMETSRFDTARIGILDGARRLDVDLRHNRRELFEDPAERVVVATEAPDLEQKLWGLMPERFTAQGPVTTDGFLYQGGKLGPVEAGRFGVYPADATVTGGTRDQAQPRAELDEQTRQSLEALGYQQ